ncbi:MAG: DinB family protein [Candidatus Acidiferrum sp.]
MRSPLASIVEELAEAQSAFFRAADTIPVKHWNRKPRAEEWSAAEVVAHLVVVESAIVGRADRITQKAPRPVSFLKRFHLPIWLAKSRIIRLNSPIPLDAALLGDKEKMLGELRVVRERALAFLGETTNRDLSSYRWRHPFLGTLDLYEWFEMIAAHQLRHTKQMNSICARLPKVVGISQK